MPSVSSLLPASALALSLVLAGCSGEADSNPSPGIVPELPVLAQAESAQTNLPATLQIASLDTPSQGHELIRDVSIDEARSLIFEKDDVVVLDVRTPGEFAQGHIEGAINLDARSETFVEDLAKLDKDTAYLLHCRSGRRSAAALAKMKEANFSKVAHMSDGLNGWTKAGLATVQ